MRSTPLPVEPWSHIVRLDDRNRAPIDFRLEPDAAARAALAERLGVLGLKKLRLSGHLRPEGRRDWLLSGELGATATQSCVVTLAPVTTRIDEELELRYAADLPEPPAGDEIEMPDERVELLPAALDLGAVMAESLALALPEWPRADGADGAELGQETAAPPGTAPLTDDDARPFAGLRRMLGGDDGEG